MKFSIALPYCILFIGVALPSPAQKLPAPAVSSYRPVTPFRVGSPAKPASTFGSNTGWGSVANPGTGHPPNTTASGIPKSGFFSGSGSLSGKARNRNGHSGIYAFPVYVPNYYDGYNYGGVNSGPQDAPPSERPTVVIQNFYPSGTAAQQQDSDTRLETYRAPAREPEMETPADAAVKAGNYYLIAYKDHHIYSALAYWIEGDTFHYVTTENTHNQTTLAEIDQDLTKRLNGSRTMSFGAAQ